MSGNKTVLTSTCHRIMFPKPKYTRMIIIIISQSAMGFSVQLDHKGVRARLIINNFC